MAGVAAMDDAEPLADAIGEDRGRCEADEDEAEAEDVLAAESKLEDVALAATSDESEVTSLLLLPVAADGATPPSAAAASRCSRGESSLLGRELPPHWLKHTLGQLQVQGEMAGFVGVRLTSAVAEDGEHDASSVAGAPTADAAAVTMGLHARKVTLTRTPSRACTRPSMTSSLRPGIECAQP